MAVTGRTGPLGSALIELGAGPGVDDVPAGRSALALADEASGMAAPASIPTYIIVVRAAHVPAAHAV